MEGDAALDVSSKLAEMMAYAMSGSLADYDQKLAMLRELESKDGTVTKIVDVLVKIKEQKLCQ